VTELPNTLVDAIQPALVAAAGQREFVLWGLVAAGVIVLIQAFLACWTILRLRELGHMRERMSRLADGLALLTDTTETGFTTISRQIDSRSGARAGAGAAIVVSLDRRQAGRLRGEAGQRRREHRGRGGAF
jgi:hypothetical protein